MVEIEDVIVVVILVVAAIQGKDVNTEIKDHVIVLTIVETIIYLGKLSELRLLILHLCLFQLLSPLLLLPLCRSPRKILSFFNFLLAISVS